tara:strand:+ start:1906 stop:2772 length:867 start_codon:yes stop_codon:yes gene_type:complete
MKDQNFKEIVFAADGLLGYTHLGVMLYLHRCYPNLYSDVDTFVGASMGSIWALLMSMNINLSNIFDIAYGVLLDDFNLSISNISYNNFEESLGLSVCKFEKLKNVIQSNFDDSLVNVTFRTHREKFNKRLVISGYNLDMMKICYFDYEQTPDMSLIDAIRISCTIPGMFEPVLYKSSLYVDPVISERIPLNYNVQNIANNTDVDSKVLVVNIKLEYQVNDIQSNVSTYLSKILYSSLKLTDDQLYKLENHIYTNIYIPMSKNLLKDFTQEDIDTMIIIGYWKAKRLSI